MTKANPYFELVVCNVTEPNADTPWRHHGEYKRDNINNLRIPSLATAHAIAKLCKIPNYQVKYVTEENLWGNVVFTTPRVAEIEKEEKCREARSLEYRYALAEAINKAGQVAVSNLGFGLSLKLTRSEARFDPKQSARILFNVKAEIHFINREGKTLSEDPSDYQNNRRIRTKDFIETMCHRGFVETLSPAEAKQIITTAILRRSAWKNGLLNLVPAPKEV